VVAADVALRLTRLEDTLKPWIVERMTASGLRLAIDGPITASLLPSPRAHATRITVRNGEGQLLAEAESASLRIAPGPLLRGALAIGEMQVKRPRIQVEINTDGQSNFDLTDSGASRPLPAARLVIEDGVLSLDDQRTKARLELAAMNVTVELGEDRSWLVVSGKAQMSGPEARAPAKSSGTDITLSLRVEPRVDDKHRTEFTLDTDEGRVSFKGTLSELSSKARAVGSANGRLHRPGLLIDAYGGGNADRLVDLPPVLRCGSVVFDADIDMSRNDFKVPRFDLTAATTEIKGEATMSLAPSVAIGGKVRIGDLVLEDFMRSTVDWFGLAELFYGSTTFVLDGLPDRGVADLRVEIERAHFNRQPIEAIDVDIGIDNHVGTLRKLTARLPGGTDIAIAATLGGTPARRKASGRLTLTGKRLAQTIRWLVPPADPEIAARTLSTRDADFKITLDLAPLDDGRHQALTALELEGVHSKATTAIRFGRMLQLDTELHIATLDALPFLPIAGPQSLKLTDLRLRSDITKDTGAPTAPITVRRTVVVLASVDVAFPPEPRPATGTPKPAVSDLLPTQVVGGFLGDLPRRVVDYLRPGPERSAAAKMAPVVETALRTMDRLLGGLDFTSPVIVKAERVTARDVPGAPDEIELSQLDMTIAANKLHGETGRVRLTTLKPRVTLGESRLGSVRIAKAALDLEASLSTTHLTALKLNRLELEGDMEDPLDDEPRRLAMALRASGESDGKSLVARIERLAAGDVATFDGIDIRVEERKDGVLSFMLATAGPGPAIAMTSRAPLRCTVTPHGPAAAPIMEFKVNLAGLGTPLVRAVQSEGFVTARAVVMRDFQMKLGESSGLGARLAVTAPDRAAGDTGLAHVDGCLDASLQARPKLPSIGHLPQQLLFPILGPLWQGDAEMIRVGVEGGFHLSNETLAGRVPLKVGIERRGRVASGRLPPLDRIELELDALRVQLQPPASTSSPARRSPLRVSFNGIRLREGREELKFAAPSGTALVAYQQAPDTRRSCEGGADMHVDIRLGAVDRINVPMVKRFLDRIGRVARGESVHGQTKGQGPGCAPLSLTVKATEIGALPDLVRALTDAKEMRIAAERAPKLRDVDFKLTVAKDLTLSFELTAALTAARAEIFRTCSGRNPKTGRPRDLDAEGTAHFRNNKWDAALKGTLTCLDLVEAQTIAQAATGLNLRGIGASVRQGDIDLLAFDLKVPPVASLGELTRASGSLDFFGDIALDVESGLYRLGVGLLGLEGVMRRGVPFTGHIEIRNGEVSGALSSKDPVLGEPRHEHHRHVQKWPDIAGIAFRGNLGKSIDTDVTVRSTDWRIVRRDNVCFDKARREKSDHFPSWVQQVTICTPLSNTAGCRALAWRQPEQREYACR
jgi:hypothetical protein